MLFTSPEPKALKWDFLVKICLLSIVIHFSNTCNWPLLRNSWASFNQMWYKVSGWRRFKIVQMKVNTIFKGEIIMKNGVLDFYDILKNHWANFNWTWHKVSLNEGNWSVLRKGYNLFKKKVIRIFKNWVLQIKNLVFKNHGTSFNQTWHRAYLIKRRIFLSLFK